MPARAARSEPSVRRRWAWVILSAPGIRMPTTGHREQARRFMARKVRIAILGFAIGSTRDLTAADTASC
jgi:hypothetical protein